MYRLCEYNYFCSFLVYFFTDYFFPSICEVFDCATRAGKVEQSHTSWNGSELNLSKSFLHIRPLISFRRFHSSFEFRFDPCVNGRCGCSIIHIYTLLWQAQLVRPRAPCVFLYLCSSQSCLFWKAEDGLVLDEMINCPQLG